MSQKWSKEIIIEMIKSLHTAGIPLNSRSIRKTQCALVGAANHHIGSWRKAIQMAGLDYTLIKIPHSKRKRKYSKESVIKEIKHIRKNGGDLSSSAIARNNPVLSGRARKCFGSHAKALEAAGIDYSSIRKREPFNKWSKERIIARIQLRARSGLPINMWTVKNDDRALYTAACRYFGNWGNAAKEAGFSELKVRADKWWNGERVVKEIKRRVRTGKSISLLDVRKTESGLYCAAIRYHGSWARAVEESGFSYNDVRKIIKWSKELIVCEIRSRHALGLPLNFKSVYRTFPLLVSRGAYHFGTWEAAVEAAGFSYTTIIQRWIFARRKSRLKVCNK